MGCDGRLDEPAADAATVVEPESRPNIIATGLVTQVPKLLKPKRTSQVSEKASTTTSRINDGIIAFANTAQQLLWSNRMLGGSISRFTSLIIEEI